MDFHLLCINPGCGWCLTFHACMQVLAVLIVLAKLIQQIRVHGVKATEMFHTGRHHWHEIAYT
jgi:hypothetical protein